jgi:hypothetical protein
MRTPRAETLLRLAPLAFAAVWCGLATSLPSGSILCGFRWLTGRPCPLCGMTHALAALAQGRWSEAIAFNALCPLAAALLLALPLMPLAPAVERRAWQGSVALFAVFGILRLL